MKPTFISLILLLILVACHENGEIARTLDIAEQQMTERPDSSFQLLSAINPDDIHSRGQNARYALLLSQAMDKNYIDETNDSLISIALNYYDDSNPYYRFMSLYYYGRVMCNAEDYAKAMWAYTEAEQIVEKVKDKPYQVALLYAQIGLMYQKFYDFQKSLAAFEKAADYYRSADKLWLHYNTKISIGQLHYSIREYAEAERQLLEALQWSYENKVPIMCQNCVEQLILIYEATNNFAKIKELFEMPAFELCNQDLPIIESKALLYAMDNNKALSDEYLSRAWQLTSNLEDSMNILFTTYRIHKHWGHNKNALKYHEKFFDLQDSIIRYAIQQPLTTTQKDYYKASAELSKYKSTVKSYVIIALIIITLLIISIISLKYRHQLQKKQADINNYIDAVQDLKSKLSDKSIALSGVAEQMDIKRDKFSRKINDLFNKQFVFFDRICNTYFETSSSPKLNTDAIYKQVRAEIDSFCYNENVYKELEAAINECKENIMQVLRSEVTLQEKDYKFICLIYAGFSAKTISVFTNDSIDNVYKRKWRIKNAIAKKSPSNYELIMKFWI